MNKSLTERLFEECPLIYRTNSDGTQTIVNRREFECGDGWFDTIYQLSTKIESIAKEMQQNGTPISGLPQVRQVKEKFGGLRFYMNRSTEEIEELIQQASLQASVTCECCGEAGYKQATSSGWIMVVCDNCAREY